MWAYSIGFFLSSMLNKVQGIVTYILPIYSRPLRSIGIIAGFVGVATYLIYAAISLALPAEFRFIPTDFDSWIIEQHK